ncbi:MAG: hypothetical protein HRU12_20070 [Phaeodactylibacter sp.]|nr:hypothetical protein [Phaeodactylibacter sp.]
MAWNGGFTTKSDTARNYADEIAAASAFGYITTQQSADEFGRSWLITPLGCRNLFNEKGIKHAE